MILQFWQLIWLSPSSSLNGPDEPPSWSSWWTAGRKSPHHHQARETLYPHPSGPSPDFGTCSPCVSHWHTSPNPWPSNPLPAKICKTHKYCHDNKHPNKRWFYSFGNEYGCPLPRAWTVLTSLLPDLLGRLLVEKNPHHHRARETLYPRPSGPSPVFWTCSPWFSPWHISPNLWPSNPRPAKICKTHKCCHENKHTNKPWFYSFGNRYGCPLPRAWTVLTSLLADPLGGLLVEKIMIIIIELKRHCILVHLGPLPTSGLALLVSLIGTPHPIHGPPILFLQRYAKPTSVVTIINTQTNVDSTVLATSMVFPFPEPKWSWGASFLIFLVDCWWKKILIIIGLEKHCILVHLGLLPSSGLALLGSLLGTSRPIYGPPILVLQRYAKLTSVVMRTNTQTSLDSTVLAIGMVVPFHEPERSLRASLQILLVDCWSKKSWSSSSSSRDTVSSSIWALSRLLDLLSLCLSLAHLTQSMALQSSSCKDMQNPQVLSR